MMNICNHKILYHFNIAKLPKKVQLLQLEQSFYPNNISFSELLPHETNMSRKPLLKTVETGQSSFRNWMVWFCRDRW
jgi:hypothetical protein